MKNYNRLVNNLIPFLLFFFLVPIGFFIGNQYKEWKKYQNYTESSFSALHNNTSAICWRYHPVYKKDVSRIIYIKNGNFFSIVIDGGSLFYTWRIDNNSVIYSYKKGDIYGSYINTLSENNDFLTKNEERFQAARKNKNAWNDWIKEMEWHCKKTEDLNDSLFQLPENIEFIEQSQNPSN
jgi:uncharacterized protein (UPF0333 family)